MSDYPRVASHVDWLEIDGQILAFDGDLLHLLPGSSAEIWRAVDGDTSTAALAASLVERHPEAPDVDRDVLSFLAELVHRGLVQFADQPVGNGFRVPSHVAWTIDEAQVVLADLRTGDRLGLPTTGSWIWQLVVERLPREQLLERLRADFPDAPVEFEADVDRLLATLLERGLLECAGNPQMSG